MRPQRPPSSSWKSFFIAMLLIVVGIALCIGAVGTVLQDRCSAEIQYWFFVYPGAKQVSQDYNFFTPNGMGITRTVYETSAPLWVVEQWYIRETRQANGVVRVKQMASVGWNALPIEGSPGTQIEFYAECANN